MTSEASSELTALEEYIACAGKPPPDGTRFLHFCWEWDFLVICEHDSEFSCCRCYDDPEARRLSSLRADENAAAFDKLFEKLI
jgi:hypothetical protein